MNVDAKVMALYRDAKRLVAEWIPTFHLALPFSERKALLLIGDMAVINSLVLLSLVLWARIGGLSPASAFVRSHWLWFPACTLAWWLAAWLLDLYDVRIAARRIETLKRLAGVVVILILGYLMIYFVLPRNMLPRLFFLIFSGATFVGTLVWRWSYATLFRMPPLARRVLIVGAGWAGQTLAHIISHYHSINYRVLGFVDDDPAKQGTAINGLPVIDGSVKLVSLVQRYRVDELVVAVTNNMSGTLFQALVDCQAAGIQIVRMPELYGELTRQIPVEHINEVWILNAMNGSSTLKYLDQIARRVLDLTLGLLGLFVLGCLFPIVSLVIYLDNRGPIIYSQVRSGLGGKPFRMFKFRTMYDNAEEDGTPRWAQRNDKRVTWVGRFFRKVRLDELPQVINILRGEMSIVGPRPERPEFIAQLEKQLPFYRTRLVVKPGLTGWAQIHYPYGNTVKDTLNKLQYDLYYIRHRSLWLDLYIIFQTVGVILHGEGV